MPQSPILTLTALREAIRGLSRAAVSLQLNPAFMPSCSNKLASGLGSVPLHWESTDQKTFDLGVFWFHCGTGFGIKHGVPKAQALLWFQVQGSQFGIIAEI